jgi:hypothetical protein
MEKNMKGTLNNKLTDTDKVKIINDFCKHLDSGNTEYSFTEFDFRDIEEFAIDLDARKKGYSYIEKIRKSMRKSFRFWENILFEIINEEKKKYLIPLWVYYMKSRYRFGIEEYKKSQPKNSKIDIKLSTESDVKEIEK